MGLAPETLRTYESSIRALEDKSGRQILAWTPQDVMKQVVDEPSYSARTKSVRLAAIRHAFHTYGRMSPTDHPEVVAVRQALHRDPHPDTPEPLTWPLLETVLSTIAGNENKDVRDRALFTVGWWVRCETVELAGLEMSDYEETAKRWFVHIKSGRMPRTASELHDTLHPPSKDIMWHTRRWLERLPGSGPMFRSVDRWNNIGHAVSAEAIRHIIRTRCAEAGLGGWFSGNSLKYGRP